MRPFKIIALAVAVIAPLLLIAKINVVRATAPIYLVRIEGYDPRDMLYGHYLTFRFVPEKSAQRDSFPKNLDAALDGIDARYYVPEDKAPMLDDILRRGDHYMSIEVGVPRNGRPFLRRLFVDGVPMRQFLHDFEDSVDFDGEIRGE